MFEDSTPLDATWIMKEPEFKLNQDSQKINAKNLLNNRIHAVHFSSLRHNNRTQISRNEQHLREFNPSLTEMHLR